MGAKLRRALEALVRSSGEGPKVARLEAVIDAETNAVLLAKAEDMARGGERSARTLRSAAVRELLRKGAAAELAEERANA